MEKYRSHYNIPEAEFEIFFRQYYKLALFISVRITNNLVSSEDIVQDVFFELWKDPNIDTLNSNLKSYLLKSVKNRSLNFNRDKKEHLEFNVNLHEYPDEGYNFEREEKISKILLEIDQLPPKCKEIFRMVIFKQLKYSEVAKILNITNNTVKTQMGIAFKRLRKIILFFF